MRQLCFVQNAEKNKILALSYIPVKQGVVLQPPSHKFGEQHKESFCYVSNLYSHTRREWIATPLKMFVAMIFRKLVPLI